MIHRSTKNCSTPAHRRGALALALLSTLLLGVPQVYAGGPHRNAFPSRHEIVGGWYLALPAGPYDPSLEGLDLSGVTHFHADGTFSISDAGDFGALDGTTAIPQYGVWKAVGAPGYRHRRAVVATSLFLIFDQATGNAIGWQKIVSEWQVADRNHAEGAITGYFLPCDNTAPIPTALTCPDPIVNAGAFVQVGPVDAPVFLTRIVPGE